MSAYHEDLSSLRRKTSAPRDGDGAGDTAPTLTPSQVVSESAAAALSTGRASLPARPCAVCGESLDGRRPQTKTCSPVCRKALSRLRRPHTNPASGSKTARAWPQRRRPKLLLEGCEPTDIELRPVAYVGIGVLLFDAYIEICACWSERDGLDRPRRKKQLRLVLRVLEDVTHHDLYIGVPEAQELRRVSRALLDTTRRNRMRGDFVEAPTVVERLARVEERLRDHHERVRELERQIGVPQGGDKAASAAVDAFLSELNDQDEGDEVK